MNMDMLVTLVWVPLLVMPWIGCEFLGLRTRNNHICGRTFGSTVRLPQWYQSLNYKEQRESIIGMIGSKRNSSNMTSEPNQPVFHNTQLSLEKLPSSTPLSRSIIMLSLGLLVITLTNGSVILLTISPDFTMRLTDPTLSQRIKIQVQLIGATQDAAAEQATLHHQVLYGVQDHALDLKLPNSTGDAFFMFHDKNHGPAIVNIPRMITTEELSSIVPLEWITNYEKAFPQQIPDVHTTVPPRITRASDGTVATVFQRPGFEGQSSFRQSSFRRICMISPISIRHTAHPDDPPVHYYDNGKPVYVSHIQGHFIWDVDPSMCDSDCDCQDYPIEPYFQRFDHRYGCYESLTPKIHSLSTASLTGEPGLG
ncbi:hypothetical protein PIB30_062594 [Stylosanthes scabra]|uniref:Uncharacterized protein n=1 Tax=Stylosanthes scabra TaxID=79078 RepID=A0ABU6VKF8_9FABA|nr:hypothetical protein [Stylosanthes scabra]